MSTLKTQPSENDVHAFLSTVEDEKKRKDSLFLLDFIAQHTGEKPVMWGKSIIGYGSYHYKYASGREGDWMLTGFSPRKTSLTIYIMSGFDKYDELMGQLGKYKTGKSCLYVKKLEDIDLDILAELIKKSTSYLKNKYS
jgi:hypothetical protein